MAKNYNIQTVSEHLDSGDVHAEVGGLVADGMTRYVTFIRVEPLSSDNNTGAKVFFCCAAISGSITAASATLTQKMVVYIATATGAGRKDVSIPASPDTEHPLFTVAAGNYLRALLSTANVIVATGSVQIFAQYYDE